MENENKDVTEETKKENKEEIKDANLITISIGGKKKRQQKKPKKRPTTKRKKVRKVSGSDLES